VIVLDAKHDKAPEHRFAPLINGIVASLDIKNILIYGDASFLPDLRADRRLQIQKYTPGFDIEKPFPCEMSVCLNLDRENIDELRKLTTIVGFFVCNQAPASIWLRKFVDDWNLQTFQMLDDSFYFIAYPEI
jgi:hypothetical protein